MVRVLETIAFAATIIMSCVMRLPNAFHAANQHHKSEIRQIPTCIEHAHLHPMGGFIARPFHPGLNFPP
jgi:hypothetical protein